MIYARTYSDYSTLYAEALKAIHNEGFVYVDSPCAEILLGTLRSGLFGQLLPQHQDGRVEYSVRAEGILADTESSKGYYGIPIHTDGIFCPTPPKYLGLYCIQPDERQECITSFCKSRDLHNGLDPITRKLIGFPEDRERPFKYSYHLAVRGTDEKSCLHVEQIIEYDRNLSPDVVAAARKLNDYYNELAIRVTLKKGELLILDNHNMVHARTTHNSGNRHLLRFWAGTK